MCNCSVILRLSKYHTNISLFPCVDSDSNLKLKKILKRGQTQNSNFRTIQNSMPTTLHNSSEPDGSDRITLEIRSGPLQCLDHLNTHQCRVHSSQFVSYAYGIASMQLEYIISFHHVYDCNRTPNLQNALQHSGSTVVEAKRSEDRTAVAVQHCSLTAQLNANRSDCHCKSQCY